MLKRLLSSIILTPLPLLAIYFGDWFLLGFTILVLVFMAKEWVFLSGLNNKKALILLGVCGILASLISYFEDWKFLELLIVGMIASYFNVRKESLDKRLMQIIGIIYISIFGVSFIYLRMEYGIAASFWVLGIVCGMDIGGYLVGCTVGGPKLIPKVSPKKTWSGLFGGVLFASIVGILYAYFTNEYSYMRCITLSILLALFSQIGDLFESYLKRRIDVKDSGDIIPGHGGILDRLDSWVFAYPLSILLFHMRF